MTSAFQCETLKGGIFMNGKQIVFTAANRAELLDVELPEGLR